jgi:hypothetical protein
MAEALFGYLCFEDRRRLAAWTLKGRANGVDACILDLGGCGSGDCGPGIKIKSFSDWWRDFGFLGEGGWGSFGAMNLAEVELARADGRKPLAVW